MERVGILVNKLQEQLAQKSEPQNMLVTVQMLYTELLSAVERSNGYRASKVSIMAPASPELYKEPAVAAVVEQPAASENSTAEKVAEPPVLQKQEESVPYVAATFVYENTSEIKSTGPWPLATAEVPTLAQHEKIVYELNDVIKEQASMNEKLKEEKTELASVLDNAPIHDLKKAISINDRHRFIEGLFRGDETMYERSIKTINNFRIFAEAEFWIQRELKLKLGWDSNTPEVKLFDQLVRRRFS